MPRRPRPNGRFGAMPIYILAAALAAIAGFAVMSLVAVPDAGQPVKIVTAEDAAGDAEKPSGLEKLVRVEPASALPDVTFTDGEGRDRNLGEWRGKVVLVNLWATWCAPCKLEMPSLDRLQAKLGGADFAVLPISLDRTGPDKPRQFLTSNGLKNLDLFLDRGNTPDADAARARPAAQRARRRQGREIARLAGPAEWDRRRSGDDDPRGDGESGRWIGDGDLFHLRHPFRPSRDPQAEPAAFPIRGGDGRGADRGMERRGRAAAIPSIISAISASAMRAPRPTIWRS